MLIVPTRTRIARAAAAPGSLTLLAALACACSAPPPPPPSLYDADPALAQMIADNDGVDGVTPLVSGFAEGAPVRYWDLGPRSDRPMDAYVLCVRDQDACVPIDHPPVVDHVPGEPGYSPYLRVVEVEVPAGFEGRLRSFDEVEAAISAGVVMEPAATSQYMHCPIADRDAQLAVGPDMTAIPTKPIWVRGLEALCFDFTATHRLRPLHSDGRMFVRNVYALTRDGDSRPLVEAARMEDLTGDGDQRDSNNILGASLGSGDYTPLWRLVRVTVPASYRSIDTSMDETMADYESAEDMFTISADYTIEPIEGRVVDYTLTETYLDCPIQSREGRL